ncbi:MAG: cell division protein FtsZ [Chloroflexi bacterium]|nr:cell division protein FtsZ [Chloroflexota bacterium]
MVETVARSPHRPHYKEAPATISVIGVGGGGCNAVMRMVKSKPVPGVHYICVNTDVKSLDKVEGAQVIQIGDQLTRGLGAGGAPAVGEQAADSGRTAMKKALGRSDLVFLTAGMGGGTGTGAAPVAAELAKQAGALVVGVVTTPFSFEGSRRLETAHSGIAKLVGKVDNLIVIHNERLLKLFKHDVPMEEALRMADEAVMLGVLSVAQLVNVPGEINVDLADVRTIMKMPGHALMAIGEGQGPGSAVEAARQAVANPLLDISIDGAKGVLFMVEGGPRLTLGEVNTTGEFIASRVDPDATIFFGMTTDSNIGDKVRITLIATGIPDAPPKQKSNFSAWEGNRPKP